MLPESKPSSYQLQLQRRLAEKRIQQIRFVLESGRQAPRALGLDPDEQTVINRLYDPNLSQPDLISCIEILEMLLLAEGLDPLISLLKSHSFATPLRERAALAIQKIGAESVHHELEALAASPSPDIRRLAGIALARSPAANG